VPDRVVVFLDWQNVYRGAREAYCALQSPHWEGQVDPVTLGRHLADDSPYDRRLKQVRIYRGQPDASKDRKGYAACSRQVGIWRQSPLVHVTTRTLRYPQGWPNPLQPGDRPQEKGIDVALAIDYVVMAVQDEYDVGILMSTDTDLKPALEAVAALKPTHGKRAEVAAWSVAGRHDRRLAIPGRNLYCHWMGEIVYNRIVDATDYSKGT
jgi:uncharacterized LabA/DUF88 family protein